MKKIFVIFIILFIAAILWFYLTHRSNEKNRDLLLYGNVDVRQVDISFRVPGRVNLMPFEEGDVVKTGQLMGTLDKTPYDSQLLQAISNRDAIKTNWENAEKIFKRRKEAIKVRGVSQEDLINSEASYNQLQSDLNAANAAVMVAKYNLDYTQTFAPTDGIILTRIREPGTVVKESDPIYTLSIATPVWIRAFVNEPQLGLVHFGMDAEIYTDTPGGTVYTGKVGFISPVSEFTPKTVQTTELRTALVYRLRIYVDNPDNGLKQGMPVTVKLLLQP